MTVNIRPWFSMTKIEFFLIWNKAESAKSNKQFLTANENVNHTQEKNSILQRFPGTLIMIRARVHWGFALLCVVIVKCIHIVQKKEKVSTTTKLKGQLKLNEL